MRQPATPSPVAAPARRARPPAREQRKFRLWPHTPSRTHTLTQLNLVQKPSSPSLRGATLRSNPDYFREDIAGLLRFARNDGGESSKRVNTRSRSWSSAPAASSARCRCRTAPTSDRLLLNTTLNNCGSSSRLVLRMKRPTRVTRGSFLVTTLDAVGSAWW